MEHANPSTRFPISPQLPSTEVSQQQYSSRPQSWLTQIITPRKLPVRDENLPVRVPLQDRPINAFLTTVGRQIGRCLQLSLTTHNAELKKKRTFRKFSYRGIDLDQYAAAPSLSSTPLSPTTNDCASDSSTSHPNNSATSSTPAPAVGSTAASSASQWV